MSKPSDLLMLSDFLIGVGQLKFRGTSVLFRLNKSVSDLLANHPSTHSKYSPMNSMKAFESAASPNYSFETITEIDDLKINGSVKRVIRNDSQNSNTKYIKNQRDVNSNAMVYEDEDEYELATHTVKVKRSGALTDITTLWDLEGATTPSALVFKGNLFAENMSSQAKPQFGRIQSVDFFNQKSQPNEMLNGLRYYERAIKEASAPGNQGPVNILKPAFNWGKVDMNSMAKCLVMMCKHVQEVMAKEERLIRINAPCYILGDIHGNFHGNLDCSVKHGQTWPNFTFSS